ncbi:MAG: c-type cytochrome [Sutterellaceae bacterium]|nr:c-type cytochrome [Burkholderiaceae bacterium]MDW8429362.1 c-type cytochrome [Sutterellaceae bacterium]
MRTPILGLIACGLAALAGPAQADAELAKKHNCVACHHQERKMLGPAFKDIAAKYTADPSAVQTLVKSIREGSVGVWGQLPMPAQPQVSEADALTLAKYVLTIK